MSNKIVHLLKKFYSKSMLRNRKKRSYALLAFPICAFGLGFWQISRKKWKTGLIEQIRTQLKEDPINLDNYNFMSLDLPEYTPVKLTGIFDYNKEAFIGPRLLINDSVPKSYQSNNNKVGYNVITSMRVVGSSDGQNILVNRGWIPKDQISFKETLFGEPDRVVEIEGLIRKSEQRSIWLPGDKVVHHADRGETTVYSCKHVPDIAKSLGTSEFLVDMKFNSDVAQRGGPIGGQSRVELRDEHLQYILTWFGLGIISSFMWIRRFR